MQWNIILYTSYDNAYFHETCFVVAVRFGEVPRVIKDNDGKDITILIVTADKITKPLVLGTNGIEVYKHASVSQLI